VSELAALPRSFEEVAEKYDREFGMVKSDLSAVRLKVGNLDQKVDTLSEKIDQNQAQIVALLTELVVILEMAVRKPWRRRGVARALHTALLKDVGAERGMLTVRPEPEAVPAQYAYEAWGYRPVGLSHPWEGAPYYTAMVLDLAAGRSATAASSWPGIRKRPARHERGASVAVAAFRSPRRRCG
jgi:GNAT superfamily N-acetyltransferase